MVRNVSYVGSGRERSDVPYIVMISGVSIFCNQEQKKVVYFCIVRKDILKTRRIINLGSELVTDAD